MLESHETLRKAKKAKKAEARPSHGHADVLMAGVKEALNPWQQRVSRCVALKLRRRSKVLVVALVHGRVDDIKDLVPPRIRSVYRCEV